MDTSELREHVRETALNVAWGQLGKLGVPTSLGWNGTAALDPEALIIFSLDIGRWDARVFEATLDWLRRNGRLLSAQRLANLVREDELGGRLAGAALTWARKHGGDLRPVTPSARKASPEVLFGGKGWREADPAFLAFGFERSEVVPSLKAWSPRLDDPVNLGLRLRRLLGVGARSEIIRFLLTWPGPHSDVADIARSAGFAKRNVAAMLVDLAAAGTVRSYRDGNRDRYSIDRARWAAFLEMDADEVPGFIDWPALYSALRGIHCWLSQDGVDDLSNQTRASEARQLVAELRPMLDRAGVRAVKRGTADEYWPSFIQTVENSLAQLSPVGSPAP